MRGIFVTGTDTGIGKTHVSAALLACARARGLDVLPMKPVQTGDDCDLDVCLRAAELDPSPEERALMCPWHAGPACSPHLAARLTGRPILLDDLLAAANELAARHDALIVEGAGGVLVPLNERQTVLDLMQRLALPVLVVARGSLGTINHSLLTVCALRGAGLRVLGVVLNDSAPCARDDVRRDNPIAVAHYGDVPVLGDLPHAFTDFAQHMPGLDAILKELA
jgi:dethiobiotin synthase